jgi:hypothetical protein
MKIKKRGSSFSRYFLWVSRSLESRDLLSSSSSRPFPFSLPPTGRGSFFGIGLLEIRLFPTPGLFGSHTHPHTLSHSSPAKAFRLVWIRSCLRSRAALVRARLASISSLRARSRAASALALWIWLFFWLEKEGGWTVCVYM